MNRGFTGVRLSIACYRKKEQGERVYVLGYPSLDGHFFESDQRQTTT